MPNYVLFILFMLLVLFATTLAFFLGGNSELNHKEENITPEPLIVSTDPEMFFNELLFGCIEEAKLRLYFENKHQTYLTPEYALKLYLVILYHELNEDEYPNIVKLANQQQVEPQLAVYID